MGDEQKTYDFIPSSLFGRHFSIDQSPLPEAGRDLTIAENMRRHKVYNTDYSHKNWNPFTMKNAGRFPRSSTDGQGDENEVVNKEDAQ